MPPRLPPAIVLLPSVAMPARPLPAMVLLPSVAMPPRATCAAAPSGPPGPHDEIRMGAFTFHVGRGELRQGDETIKLTERERDLLRSFAHRIGTPIPRHELSSEDSTGNDRAIDVQINRLRRKIETDPSNPVYLQTVRGKGYILYSD